ncbi:hypothetical protein [Streptomyces humicola]|uniref:hypothetical protein n=1 Tax=Streptomyces humicola TaxID=2953240 RepID=UPI0027E224AA|nr:hypothetical protein [Streptomyces humicola]
MEARDCTGAFYPLAERLRSHVIARHGPDGEQDQNQNQNQAMDQNQEQEQAPAEVVDFIHADLTRYAAALTLTDDVAVIAVSPAAPHTP